MVEYDREGGRLFTSWSYRSEMWRSSIVIRCPFCGQQFTAYVWSLSGGGKKCPDCGAMHGSSGTAYPVKPRLLRRCVRVQSIPDGDYGVVKDIDGMVLVAWENGQETWASLRNLRRVP